MKRPNWHEVTALVTGASSGIGESVARLLAHQGIHVIAVARRHEKLITLQDQVQSAGGNLSVYQCDLTLSAKREELFRSLTNDAIFPEVLINNAGLAWYGYFHQMPTTIINDIISLNIHATSHLMRLFLPKMIENRFGRVINIGSIAGKLPEQGIAVYSASKAYLDAITTSTYRELRNTGVTASVLRAGPVKTEFFDRARQLENGRSVPAEAFAISSQRVSRAVWSLVQRPRRFAYVPFYLMFSPLLETLFSGFIDLAGPLLLRKKK